MLQIWELKDAGWKRYEPSRSAHAVLDLLVGCQEAVLATQDLIGPLSKEAPCAEFGSGRVG